jgi:hypothetical protein
VEFDREEVRAMRPARLTPIPPASVLAEEIYFPVQSEESPEGRAAVMSAEEFEQTLLRYKYREPFEPFVVELRDGRTIPIDEPSILFDEKGATYITPDFDFVGFSRENVQAIRPPVQGVAS